MTAGAITWPPAALWVFSTATAPTRGTWGDAGRSAPRTSSPVSRPSGVATGRICTPQFAATPASSRSEEHTSELQSQSNLVCRLLLEKKLVQEIGREPIPGEIAEKMELPLDKVRKVLKIAKEPISLETPIGEEEDSHLGDFIEDKAITSPSDAVINMNLAEQTRKVLATLTPREEKVLRMRFGIGEKSDHTLEEVGQDFEVTRERIRQIEAKALRKLRHPSRSKRLRSFVEN